ncbi:UNVERIFIED_ORG: LexA-binding, inner membrane-associated putative hydrolase [Anoxybacillus amylolyticus]
MKKQTHVLGGLFLGSLLVKCHLITPPVFSPTSSVSDSSELDLSIVRDTAMFLVSGQGGELVAWGFFFLGCLLGAVFLDIDHPNSFIGRRMKVTSFLVHQTFGHRGWTHSLSFVLGFGVLLYIGTFALSPILQDFSLKQVILFFAKGWIIGMVSHLFLDMMTKGGVPLLHPFSKKRISLSPIKTGSLGEFLVFLVMLFGEIVVVAF